MDIIVNKLKPARCLMMMKWESKMRIAELGSGADDDDESDASEGCVCGTKPVTSTTPPLQAGQVTRRWEASEAENTRKKVERAQQHRVCANTSEWSKQVSSA